MKKLFLFIFIFITTVRVFPQTMLSIKSLYNQQNNTNISVKVRANSLTNIEAISLSIKYDTTIMKYDSISSNIGMLSNASKGVIKIAWIDFSGGANPLSIINGDFFNLNFTYLSGASKLEFYKTDCELRDINDSIVYVQYSDGVVTSEINSVNVDSRNIDLFSLKQNYPNPFNPSTMIGFTLKKASRVRLVIFNLIGERISTLIDKEMGAGEHNVLFNSKNINSGIYFYKLEAGSYSETKKMILLK
jgi:hypothetical protein